MEPKPNRHKNLVDRETVVDLVIIFGLFAVGFFVRNGGLKWIDQDVERRVNAALITETSPAPTERPLTGLAGFYQRMGQGMSNDAKRMIDKALITETPTPGNIR